MLNEDNELIIREFSKFALAKKLGLRTNKIDQLLKSGQLKGRQDGKRIKIPLHEVIRWQKAELDKFEYKKEEDKVAGYDSREIFDNIF